MQQKKNEKERYMTEMRGGSLFTLCRVVKSYMSDRLVGYDFEYRV